MDNIADRVYEPPSTDHSYKVDETPSLLSVILDLNPLEWSQLSKVEGDNAISIREVISCLLITLNSHLALNSSNKVAIYIANSYSKGACLIYPKTDDLEEESSEKKKRKKQNSLITNGLYRQFQHIDEIIIDEILELIEEQPNQINNKLKGTLSGAISMALSYCNKIHRKDELSTIKTRLLVISISDDQTLSYLPMMNCIFASQKMKISIDICKLNKDSTFLQQAADLTNGIYIFVKHSKGLIQYFTTALFIDPNLRPLIVLPTNSNIDFRASCFITNKVIDIGYVCSVCLCILSLIPQDEKCPFCHSKFDSNITSKLKRKPKVLGLKKKKKIVNNNGNTITDDESLQSTPVPN